MVDREASLERVPHFSFIPFGCNEPRGIFEEKFRAAVLQHSFRAKLSLKNLSVLISLKLITNKSAIHALANRG